MSTDTFKKGTRVVLNSTLNGVPEGTAGKVGISSGLTWLKYWVTFDNGRQMGSVGHTRLVPEGEWEHYLENREAYRVRRIAVKRGDTIEAVMAPGGGHCIRLAPAR